MACMAMGYDHPHVALLLNNIGVLHFESGDLLGCLNALEESLELQRMLLRSTLLNVEHSLHQLAMTMGNLAMAYERRGQCDHSISLLQQSLLLCESMDNPKSQDTMEIVSLNIERLENNTDNNNNIELDLKRQPVECVQSRAKLDHSAPGMHIAQSHRSAVTPDNNDGPPNPRSKADRSTEMFGNSDRPSTSRGKAHSMVEDSNNHDFLLLGSLSPLLTPMEQVRQTILAWFGPDRSFVSLAKSPSTASAKRRDTSGLVSLENELHLAEVHLQAVGHLERNEIMDALDLLRDVLLDQRQRYGNIHHLVGSSLHSIGMVHLFAKQYIQARACFTDAIYVRSEALGPDHPDVAASKMKIGMIQLAAGELEEARMTFNGIREMFLNALGYAHPQFAKIVNNLGVVLYHSGDLSGAMQSFELAYEYHHLRHQDGLGGSALADLGNANCLCNIGFIFAKMLSPLDAVGCYEQALQFRRKHLKEDDERVLDVRRSIAFLVATGGSPMWENVQTWENGHNSCDPACDVSCMTDDPAGDVSCMTDLFGAAFARY
jgi:tetratricopeptide (TPR) repeat protein